MLAMLIPRVKPEAQAIMRHDGRSGAVNDSDDIHYDGAAFWPASKRAIINAISSPEVPPAELSSRLIATPFGAPCKAHRKFAEHK